MQVFLAGLTANPARSSGKDNRTQIKAVHFLTYTTDHESSKSGTDSRSNNSCGHCIRGSSAPPLGLLLMVDEYNFDDGVERLDVGAPGYTVNSIAVNSIGD